MRDLAGLLKIARSCTSQFEADRLVREEVESRMRTYEDVDEADQRVNVVCTIRYVLRRDLQRADYERVVLFFPDPLNRQEAA